MATTSKRLKRTALVAVPVVVVVGLGTMFALPPIQSADVDVPPDDATPTEVATAYLTALDEHDCDTARVLASAENRPEVESWCHNVAALDDIEVRDPVVKGQQASVPVHFDADWRPFRSVGTLEEGSMPWSLVLRRDSEDDPWRIVEQGLS